MARTKVAGVEINELLPIHISIGQAHARMQNCPRQDGNLKDGLLYQLYEKVSGEPIRKIEFLDQI